MSISSSDLKVVPKTIIKIIKEIIKKENFEEFRERIYNPKKYVQTSRILFYFIYPFFKYLSYTFFGSFVLLVIQEDLGILTVNPPDIFELMFILSAVAIVYTGLFIILLTLTFPPHNIRGSHHLDYAQEYVQSKKGKLTHDDKKKITYYFSEALDYIPGVLKRSKTGLDGVDEDLDARFSSMEKEIVRVSKDIFFDTDTDFTSQINDIERISQILKTRDFGRLEVDRDYELETRSRFWHKIIDPSIIKKHVSEKLGWLPTIIGIILIVIILKEYDPELFKEIISIISLG